MTPEEESASSRRLTRKNDTQMKIRSGVTSHTSQEDYLEKGPERYPSRSRAGRSAMIDEVSNTLGWDRKHTLKALNRQVSQVSQVTPPAAASIQWNLPPTLKRDREGSSLSLSAMKKTVRKKSNELASPTSCAKACQNQPKNPKSSQALGVMNPSATTHPLRFHLSLAQYGLL